MRPRGRVSYLSIGASSSLRGELDRLSRDPNALMLPALAAHAAGYVCGIGSVFKVVTGGWASAASNLVAHSSSVLASPTPG